MITPMATTVTEPMHRRSSRGWASQSWSMNSKARFTPCRKQHKACETDRFHIVVHAQEGKVQTLPRATGDVRGSGLGRVVVRVGGAA
jgi:hypothetical protein